MGVGRAWERLRRPRIQLRQGLSGFERRPLYQRSPEGPLRTDSYNRALFRPGGTP
jgi:hypothetical protein